MVKHVRGEERPPRRDYGTCSCGWRMETSGSPQSYATILAWLEHVVMALQSELCAAENPIHDLSWVEKTTTVDAVDYSTAKALDENPGWRLIGLGVGYGGQTTLTYGWPWSTPVERQ